MEKTAGHETARSAYFALFHARMAYAIEIWGHSTHIKLVLGQQKKAVTALGGANNTTSCRSLFRRLNILTVHAEYLLRTIPKQGDHHQHTTRNRDYLRYTYTTLTTTSSVAILITKYIQVTTTYKRSGGSTETFSSGSQ